MPSPSSTEGSSSAATTLRLFKGRESKYFADPPFYFAEPPNPKASPVTDASRQKHEARKSLLIGKLAKLRAEAILPFSKPSKESTPEAVDQQAEGHIEKVNNETSEMTQPPSQMPDTTSQATTEGVDAPTSASLPPTTASQIPPLPPATATYVASSPNIVENSTLQRIFRGSATSLAAKLPPSVPIIPDSKMGSKRALDEEDDNEPEAMKSAKKLKTSDLGSTMEKQPATELLTPTPEGSSSAEQSNKVLGAAAPMPPVAREPSTTQILVKHLAGSDASSSMEPDTATSVATKPSLPAFGTKAPSSQALSTFHASANDTPSSGPSKPAAAFGKTSAPLAASAQAFNSGVTPNPPTNNASASSSSSVPAKMPSVRFGETSSVSTTQTSGTSPMNVPDNAPVIPSGEKTKRQATFGQTSVVKSKEASSTVEPPAEASSSAATLASSSCPIPLELWNAITTSLPKPKPITIAEMDAMIQDPSIERPEGYIGYKSPEVKAVLAEVERNMREKLKPVAERMTNMVQNLLANENIEYVHKAFIVSADTHGHQLASQIHRDYAPKIYEELKKTMTPVVANHLLEEERAKMVEEVKDEFKKKYGESVRRLADVEKKVKREESAYKASEIYHESVRTDIRNDKKQLDSVKLEVRQEEEHLDSVRRNAQQEEQHLDSVRTAIRQEEQRLASIRSMSTQHHGLVHQGAGDGDEVTDHPTNNEDLGNDESNDNPTNGEEFADNADGEESQSASFPSPSHEDNDPTNTFPDHSYNPGGNMGSINNRGLIHDLAPNNDIYDDDVGDEAEFDGDDEEEFSDDQNHENDREDGQYNYRSNGPSPREATSMTATLNPGYGKKRTQSETLDISPAENARPSKRMKADQYTAPDHGASINDFANQLRVSAGRAQFSSYAENLSDDIPDAKTALASIKANAQGTVESNDIATSAGALLQEAPEAPPKRKRGRPSRAQTAASKVEADIQVEKNLTPDEEQKDSKAEFNDANASETPKPATRSRGRPRLHAVETGRIEKKKTTRSTAPRGRGRGRGRPALR